MGRNVVAERQIRSFGPIVGHSEVIQETAFEEWLNEVVADLRFDLPFERASKEDVGP